MWSPWPGGGGDGFGPAMVGAGGRGVGRVARSDSSVVFGSVGCVGFDLSMAVDSVVRIDFDSLVAVDGGSGGGGAVGDAAVDGGAVGVGGGVSDFGFDPSVPAVNGSVMGFVFSVVAGRGDVNDVDPSVVTLGGDLIDGRYGCSQPSSTKAAV